MNPPASAMIDKRIAELGGWRGERLSRMRALIKAADPDIIEERKWFKPSNPSGVPVWSHARIVCTGETHKATVKLTFAKGAAAALNTSSAKAKTKRVNRLFRGVASLAATCFFQSLRKYCVAINTYRHFLFDSK
jgi:hypothetical protein